MKRQMVIFAASFAAISAWADMVTFKSGSKLTGTLVHVEGGTITFKSDDVGEVKIPQDKVAELSTEKENTILFVDKSRKSAVLALKDGEYTASGEKLDMSGVKAVNPEEEKWHGSINVAASASRGNTVGEKVTVLADVYRRWEHDRFQANAGYYFDQSGDSKETKRKTEDRIVLAAQEDHFWLNKVYQYVNGKYETDRIKELDSRVRLGTGIGYQWLENQNFDLTGTWSFSQEAGLEYVKERWQNAAPDQDDYFCSFRYAHHLKFVPRFVKQLEWFHNLEYHPSVEDWAENYVLNADLGFTTVVWGGFDLIAKMEWDYNSLPAEHAKRSDLRYIVGLGYKW